MSAEDFCYDSLFDFEFNYSSEYILNNNNLWTPNNPDASVFTTDIMEYQPNNWQCNPRNDWSNKNILHWMCQQASENNKNYEKMNLENLVDVTPDYFKTMTVEDFALITESTEDAELFYKSKENLLKQQIYCDNNNFYDVNVNHTTKQNQGLSQIYSEEKSSTNNETHGNKSEPKKKRGRPKSSDRILKKPEKKLGKLWEFLRNLLLDNKTCPSLIKWDDYNEGTFKFVESEKVAKLWGDRKDNSGMNYEKLSRAMRYYYKNKVLLPVSGRRLVYKFGPQATGWKTSNPILDNN